MPIKPCQCARAAAVHGLAWSDDKCTKTVVAVGMIHKTCMAELGLNTPYVNDKARESHELQKKKDAERVKRKYKTDSVYKERKRESGKRRYAIRRAREASAAASKLAIAKQLSGEHMSLLPTLHSLPTEALVGQYCDDPTTESITVQSLPENWVTIPDEKHARVYGLVPHNLPSAIRFKPAQEQLPVSGMHQSHQPHINQLSAGVADVASEPNSFREPATDQIADEQ